ncbi:hypothetical protein [Paenibacillus sp. FSL R7-0026]|uniref:hypothetical protein n=1 Tax=Paenibacillus sp. FSL R7-0026 TaxID=2921668 RepID=UPI0030FCB349
MLVYLKNQDGMMKPGYYKAEEFDGSQEYYELGGTIVLASKCEVITAEKLNQMLEERIRRENVITGLEASKKELGSLSHDRFHTIKELKNNVDSFLLHFVGYELKSMSEVERSKYLVEPIELPGEIYDHVEEIRSYYKNNPKQMATVVTSINKYELFGELPQHEDLASHIRQAAGYFYNKRGEQLSLMALVGYKRGLSDKEKWVESFFNSINEPQLDKRAFAEAMYKQYVEGCQSESKNGCPET